MISGSRRYNLYVDRVNAAWDGLTEDIECWQDSLSSDTVIWHHVDQFGKFCQRAHDCLMQAYQDGGWGTTEEQITFRSLVTGVLTSQWGPLRQIAHQHLAGNPYQQNLEEYDQGAANYYHRLYQALPEETHEQLSLSPPLVYLGRLAELTLFSPKAPAVLCIPFGAPYSEQTTLAIPHEVGHAIFNQLPGFLPELKRRVQDSLANTNPDQRQKVIHKMIMNWLDEIVIDQVGTALAGLAFARSALWIAVSPDDTVSITDNDHPVGLIRPYVHLETLKYLRESNDADVETLEREIGEIVEGYLDRRLESGPALIAVSLRTVRDEMVRVIGYVLDSKLDALGGESLGDVLRDCATGGAAGTGTELPLWGEISNEECQQFVLELPDSLRLDYATPATSRLLICCLLRLFFCCVP